MGSAFHAALEVVKQNGESRSTDGPTAAVFNYYNLLDNALDLDYEKFTVAALVNGYIWRWSNAPLAIVASEQSFELPLRNPETGASSRRFLLAGKTDGICRLEDTRLAVLEHKLQSDSLDSDSDFRRRLLMDPQISLYVHAARLLGHDVSTVLYDVTRKPTIKPTAIPLLDNEGLKIVRDEKGERQYKKDGSPYQSPSRAKNWQVETRLMSPSEWGAKLIADVEQRIADDEEAG